MDLRLVVSGPLAAAAGLVSAVVMHLWTVRTGSGLVRAYAASLCGGLLALTLVVAWAAPSQWLWPGVTALSLFISWWLTFLMFVQCVESSIRVRILDELETADGSMPRTALLERYNDASLIRMRLRRLMEGGGVTSREGRLYVVSAPMVRWARLVRSLKMLLFGHPSEFGWRPPSGRGKD